MITSGRQAGCRRSELGEHAAEVVGDIANFTNVEPIMQISERATPPG